MNEVPFTKLGEGQSARLVYQVMGAAGPISNPAGIRFMDPGSSGAAATLSGGPVPGLFSASGAVGLMDLGVGLANFALSAATLQAVRRVERKVDDLWLQAQYQTRQLTDVAQRLERVDVNVAEQNLRSALRHVLARASTPDGFDLSAMSALCDDFDKFSDSLGPWGFGLAPNLKFSTDVRAMVSSVWHLVHGSQLSLIAAHNAQVAGDPERSLRHPMDDLCSALFGSLPAATAARVHITRVLEHAPAELGDAIYNNFTFAGEADRQNYASWLDDRVSSQVRGALEAADPLASALADMLEPTLPVMETDDDLAGVMQWVSDYLVAWVMSDAGLLFRAECTLRTSTHDEFWQQLTVGEDLSPCFAIDIEQAYLTLVP